MATTSSTISTSSTSDSVGEGLTVDKVVSNVEYGIDSARRGVEYLKEQKIIDDDGFHLPLKKREELGLPAEDEEETDTSSGYTAAGGAGSDTTATSSSRELTDEEKIKQRDLYVKKMENKLVVRFHNNFHKGLTMLIASFPENVELASAIADYERDWMRDEAKRIDFVKTFHDTLKPYFRDIENLQIRNVLDLDTPLPILETVHAIDMWNDEGIDSNSRKNIATWARTLVVNAKLLNKLPSTAMRNLERAFRTIRLNKDEAMSVGQAQAIAQHIFSHVAAEDADELLSSGKEIFSDMGGLNGIFNILELVGAGEFVENVSAEVNAASKEGGLGGAIAAIGNSVGSLLSQNVGTPDSS